MQICSNSMFRQVIQLFITEQKFHNEPKSDYVEFGKDFEIK